jgi:dynamin 1-like protein
MDLTLVDLPGLTKVPTGDQPADISKRIQELVLKYVRHKSCLILAVSAATNDIATSDALALARQVDPEGERTLGVLTKLDLADNSITTLEALSGKIYPLRLGYVGVVCQSDRASKSGNLLTFEEALSVEAEFLKRSRTFRGVVEQCGIPHLARRLHELLLKHIRQTLPELRTRVQRSVDELKQELASYGDPDLRSSMGEGAFLLHLISGYVRNFAEAIEGRLAYTQHEAPPDRLVGGARLHYIFHRVFAQAVLNFDPFTGLSDLEIRASMRNAAGPKPQLFVPEVAFETLVKRQIAKLEDPSLQCVQLAYEELKHLALQSDVPEMQRFPALREKVLEVAQGVVLKCLQPTNTVVSNLIRIELAHINVEHADFIGGLNAMSNVQASVRETATAAAASAATTAQQRDEGNIQAHVASMQQQQVEFQPSTDRATTAVPRKDRWGVIRNPSPDDQLRLPAVPNVVTPSGEPSEKERMDTELLKSLVSSYFNIVKRKIVDAVPKTIVHFMVNAVRDALLHECLKELYRSDLYTTLLTEADDIREGSETCKRRLEELRHAQEILASIRDTAI